MIIVIIPVLSETDTLGTVYVAVIDEQSVGMISSIGQVMLGRSLSEKGKTIKFSLKKSNIAGSFTATHHFY